PWDNKGTGSPGSHPNRRKPRLSGILVFLPQHAKSACLGPWVYLGVAPAAIWPGNRVQNKGMMVACRPALCLKEYCFEAFESVDSSCRVFDPGRVRQQRYQEGSPPGGTGH